MRIPTKRHVDVLAGLSATRDEREQDGYGVVHAPPAASHNGSHWGATYRHDTRLAPNGYRHVKRRGRSWGRGVAPAPLRMARGERSPLRIRAFLRAAPGLLLAPIRAR